MEMTEQFDNGKGISKTIVEMMQKDTFEGWDFEEPWTIIENIKRKYPCMEHILLFFFRSTRKPLKAFFIENIKNGAF